MPRPFRAFCRSRGRGEEKDGSLPSACEYRWQPGHHTTFWKLGRHTKITWIDNRKIMCYTLLKHSFSILVFYCGSKGADCGRHFAPGSLRYNVNFYALLPGFFAQLAVLGESSPGRGILESHAFTCRGSGCDACFKAWSTNGSAVLNFLRYDLLISGHSSFNFLPRKRFTI